jgi:hypothetical protein
MNPDPVVRGKPVRNPPLDVEQRGQLGRISRAAWR